MSAAPRVLVVEDDAPTRDALVATLDAAGHDVEVQQRDGDLDGALALFRPDLLLVCVAADDVQGPDGLALVRRARTLATLPVVVVAATDDLADRLAGFEAGADDVVPRSCAPAELLARVHAVLRRAGRLVSDTWQVADLVVDEGARLVHRGGVVVELTATQFDLLAALGASRGRVVTKEDLLARVWQFDSYDPNVVEVHVSALRRRLEAHGGRLVHTVRGVGYVLRP